MHSLQAALAEDSQDEGVGEEAEDTQEDTLGRGVLPYRNRADTGRSNRTEGEDTFQRHDCCQAGSVQAAGSGNSTASLEALLAPEVASLWVQ